MFVSSVRAFGFIRRSWISGKRQKVIVLEGARVGFGASGRSGGQAINGFEEGIDEYIAQVGFDKAKQLLGYVARSHWYCDERIAKYGIQCDWKKGYATLALNERRMDDLIEMEKSQCDFWLWQNATLG